jgi:FG-GAP-like repeat
MDKANNRARIVTSFSIAVLSVALIVSSNLGHVSASPEPEQCSTPSFANPSVFGVGQFPFSAAVADFNLDGNPDLVTANVDSGNVTVPLGDGGGTFAQATGSPHAVGDMPISVATGDFNLDGNPDIAVANFSSQTISMLLGDGGGGFSEAPSSPFVVGSNPRSLAVADFNIDGKLDLAVAKSLAAKVAIMLGDGSGDLGAPSDFNAGIAPSFLVSADFNLDGNPDLATTNLGAATVTVLLGDGSGGLGPAPGSPFAVGASPWSIAVNDYDGDGNPDLAVSNFASQSISILPGNGSGSFGAASNIGVGAFIFTAATGDFNLDGNADLAFVIPGGQSLGVMLGDGSGGFGAITQLLVASNSPNFVLAHDLNSDGRTDLVSTNGIGNVSVFINTCGVNAPPVAICKDISVDAGPACAADAIIDNGSFDPDSADSITLSQSPAGPYPLGQTDVTLTVTDNQGASSSCQATITVVDNTPPSIGGASANPSVLWSPDHTMRDVTVDYTSADNCSQPTCVLTVTSSEPINGTGDGDTAPDWQIVDSHHLRLRAERSGGGNGRIYTVTIKCSDGSGNVTTRSVTVGVPH